MPAISFDIPAGQAARVLNGFCTAHGYQATVDDGQGAQVANPESRQEFLRRKIKQFVLESVKSAETATAVETARQAAIVNADSGITLT